MCACHRCKPSNCTQQLSCHLANSASGQQAISQLFSTFASAQSSKRKQKTIVAPKLHFLDSAARCPQAVPPFRPQLQRRLPWGSRPALAHACSEEMPSASLLTALRAVTPPPPSRSVSPRPAVFENCASRCTWEPCAALRAAPPGRYAPRALRAQPFWEHEKKSLLLRCASCIDSAMALAIFKVYKLASRVPAEPSVDHVLAAQVRNSITSHSKGKA